MALQPAKHPGFRRLSSFIPSPAHTDLGKVSTIPRRSMVGVTHLPAIHRAGQLGLQIAVSGPPPLDATELKPSSVTNCITAIPVGFTPCSMNCSKRLHDDTLGKHFRKMSPERADLGTFHLTSGKSRGAGEPYAELGEATWL